MKIGGLDIGTTGCKLTLFDGTGRQLARAYRDYPVRRDLSGHEIDACALLDAAMDVIREVASAHPDIDGIGVTSFGETFVLTDGEGRPLHPAMLYTDPRGERECRQLAETLSEEKICRITGLRPHEMYSISKLAWIRNKHPEIYDAAAHAFLIEDLVVFALTGKAQIDYSLASRTMAFDVNCLKWSGEIFDAAGVDISLMSEPVPTGTPAGLIRDGLASQLGVRPGCMIVSVSHDQISAAVGAGAFDPDVAVDGAGTVECLTPIYDHMPDPAVMAEGYFSTVPYVIPGRYAAYAFSYTGGALLQWCTDRFASAEKKLAADEGISVNEYLERAYKGEGPTGLLVLPHFAGAATPYMDTGSRGAVIGLDMETDLPTLYRACMEGVAYEMRVNYEALRRTGAAFKKLNATGGGAKSAVWMQMKADVLGVPVTALSVSDAGTVGSAMLTGVAVGAFRDLSEAASVMVRELQTYQPRPEMGRRYDRVFERYARVYDAVRPLV
ncbi:MAG: carbohydrate kinase [Lachnospiraceae bacterium]|nr:carbohydrate kinase [Lachnospiraceae bacterium]